MTTEELIILVNPKEEYTSGYTPKANPYITVGKVTYIGLTQNKFTIIDTEDLPKVEKYRWHAGTDRKMFYAKTRSRNQTLNSLHALVFPVRGIIDHINRNGLDNRKENLRNANESLNRLNTNARSSSGYLGVHKHTNKWAVKIQVKGKETYFGRFKTPEEANIVAKRERERIIKELEQELAQNTPH